MRLRSGKITNKEVLVPTRRRYIIMANPRNINTNEEQSLGSTGGDIIVAPSTGASAYIISMTVAHSIMQDGAKILLSIVSSTRVSPGVTQFMASDFRPCSPSLTLPMFRREKPYGMPTTVVVDLH